MKKIELKKLPVGSIFHLNYDGMIYKYVKYDSEHIRRIKESNRYGVSLNYNIIVDFKISGNSIFVDNWNFEKEFIKVVKIEIPTQYDQIVME